MEISLWNKNYTKETFGRTKLIITNDQNTTDLKM